jgi:hypothetical protein
MQLTDGEDLQLFPILAYKQARNLLLPTPLTTNSSFFPNQLS